MKSRLANLGWRVLPGGIAAASMALLLKLGALQPLEFISYQLLFQLRGEQPWDDRIVLINIDDATVKRLGRFPFSRQYHTQLLKRLSAADASVVAFDVLFSESTPDDRAFAQTIANSNRVVLALGNDRSRMPLLPVPLLREAALGSGHIRTTADSDGMIRKIDPQYQGNVAFAIAALEGYGLTQGSVPPIDLSQPIWLNWTSDVRHLSQYSYADVLQGWVNDRAFHNKIVLVGVTASGLDLAWTPYDHHPPANGVHVQATLIHNLLQRNALRPFEATWLLLLLGGPLLSFGLSVWRTEMQAAIAVGSAIGWGGIAVLFLKLNGLAPVALPIGLIALTTVLTVLTERLRMNAILQQQVRQLWQRYQSDLVVSPPQGQPAAPICESFASIQRITQLAALADQFGRSQSTQAAIARNLSVGLVAADFDGLVWFCNPIAAKLLMLEIGSRLDAQLVPQWLHEAEWKAALQALRSANPAQPKEHLMGNRWYCLQLAPLNYAAVAPQTRQSSDETLEPEPGDEDFQLDGILILLDDITDRKKIEASLDQQIDELHQMSILKDEFLSTVSHELRTPLTNMKMAIQLLKIASSDQQRQHYLQILDNECTREAELINDLLDLQRLDAGGQDLRPENIELQRWLSDLISPFYKRTEARDQNLSVWIDERLDRIVCDRASLERITVELVNNACKYTPPEGDIKVVAALEEPRFSLTVSNSGVEIPAEELCRVFDRFYRVPQADPFKQGGTGLGLALVQRLVHCLDGTIGVTSDEGWTTFTVSVPLKI